MSECCSEQFPHRPEDLPLTVGPGLHWFAATIGTPAQDMRLADGAKITYLLDAAGNKHPDSATD